MCSKTLLVGAVPHAALDSCQRPVQIRGTVSEPSWKDSMFVRGVREEASEPVLLFTVAVSTAEVELKGVR